MKQGATASIIQRKMCKQALKGTNFVGVRGADPDSRHLDTRHPPELCPPFLHLDSVHFHCILDETRDEIRVPCFPLRSGSRLVLTRDQTL